MSDVEDYEVMVEQEEMVDNKKATKKKYAVALCVAATYQPETNTIVIAAVCKDTKIPVPPQVEAPSSKENEGKS